MQGPEVSITSKIRSGPNVVEIKVVSQGKELNQDSNHLWLALPSFLYLANPSLTFVMESLTALNDLHKSNLLHLELHKALPVEKDEA